MNSTMACYRKIFASQKELADKSMAQLQFDEITRVLFADGNSIAVVAKHMAGNMKSRWTDFLTSDGEKPWRYRDSEFVDDFTSAEELTAAWESGWKVFFDTLDSLTDADLHKKVMIRNESHSVQEALLRQVSHYGYHVGQIVLIARSIRGMEWNTLSVPRGKSEEFNREKMGAPLGR